MCVCVCVCVCELRYAGEAGVCVSGMRCVCVGMRCACVSESGTVCDKSVRV